MNFHNQHQRLRRLAYKNGSNSGLNGSNSTNSSSSSLGHSRQTLETLIYKASAEGDAETLGKLFEGRDVEFLRECLNYVPPLTNTTPLIVAARNGHAPVVKLLLENGADASQCGSVIFDGDHIPRVPPLWAASAAGHIEVVKCLVKNGVDVNQTSSTNSTPLRGACYDGHLDIVKFLVANGADIEIPNRHGHTALMIASYRMKTTVVEYLLSLGAKVDRRSLKGNTALHDAAEAGSAEIVTLLLEAGAKVQADDYGVSPLLTAANLGHIQLLPQFFPHANVWERRDAWKLLGATMVDRRNDFGNALHCWRNAFSFGAEELAGEEEVRRMDLKWDDAKRRIYGDYREARNVAEVALLAGDPEAIRMQALLVRERILGESHLETHYYLRYRGQLLFDHHQWRRSYDYWTYLLQLQQHYLHPLSLSTHSTIAGLFEAFSALIEDRLIAQRNVQEERDDEGANRNVPNIEQVVWVLERAVWEVERFIRVEDSMKLELIYEERNLRTECESLMHLCLQLIHTIYRIKAFLTPLPTAPPPRPPFPLFLQSDPHNFHPANQWALNAPTCTGGGECALTAELRRCREEFNQCNFLAPDQPFCPESAYLSSLLDPLPPIPKAVWPMRPRCPHLRCLLRRMLGAFRMLKLHPLHMACAEHPLEEFHRRMPSKFVVEWLLCTGVDVWEMDEETDDTALHVALKNESPRSNIVKLLLDAGAPLLARNRANETCLQLMQKCAPEMPKQLRVGRYLSLKQVAANAVMRNLSGMKTFEDILPRELEEFLRVF